MFFEYQQCGREITRHDQWLDACRTSMGSRVNHPCFHIFLCRARMRFRKRTVNQVGSTHDRQHLLQHAKHLLSESKQLDMLVQ